ncbi:VOC family protein [Pelagicoccus albus]|uniref:VOC family protein n=1 Tax=Pelagicoccus albus TaxID=415222 RepID=A0A7X1B3L2_9BACT|nr:VOC family protein [Pelagicoccus albus]MBC2604794.1 VOC family protein [Pelagicoccus albus]
MKRLFDHIDLRVRSMEQARPFYAAFLPAIGFSEYCETPIGIAFGTASEHPKPEFIGIIEDSQHNSNATRIAFWMDSKEELDQVALVVASAGAQNIEGPLFCPEYSPTYYAMFFEDPCGNRLELCSRFVNG